MYWILVLQIMLTPCQGDRCALSQPASAPVASLEACETQRAILQTWGGDGTRVTLADTATPPAMPAQTLELHWRWVPAHVTTQP